MTKHAYWLPLVTLVACVLMPGCSSATYARFASAAVAPSLASAPNSNPKLMIFGGTDHNVYLGCLNCSKFATDSVFNEYGTHGSRYSSESIFNHYSQFGSPYSTDSPCNKYASDPPVIVDSNGNYYGHLTLNQYANDLGIGGQYTGWLAAICER